MYKVYQIISILLMINLTSAVPVVASETSLETNQALANELTTIHQELNNLQAITENMLTFVNKYDVNEYYLVRFEPSFVQEHKEFVNQYTLLSQTLDKMLYVLSLLHHQLRFDIIHNKYHMHITRYANLQLKLEQKYQEIVQIKEHIDTITRHYFTYLSVS